MKSKGSFFQNTALIFFAILVTAFFCEWVWRISSGKVKPMERYTSGVYFDQRPYVEFSGMPLQKIGLGSDEQFNKLGYRGNLPNLPKPENEFRVFVYGGSTVLGHKLDIVSLMERELKGKTKKRIRAYNFGVASSVSGQTVSRFVHEGIDYKPDFVLVYNGMNDLIFDQHHDPRPGYPFNFVVTENNPIYHTSVSDYPLLDLVLFSSKFLRDRMPNYFIDKFADTSEIIEQMGLSEGELRKQTIKKYFENMKKIDRMATALNISSAWVLQPTTIFKKHKVGVEKNYSSPESVKESVESREFLRELIANEAKPLPFYDRTYFFDDLKEQLYFDECHVLDEKKHLVAKMLADILLQELVLPAPSYKAMSQ